MTLIAWISNNPGTVKSRGAELLALGQLPLLLLLLLLWVQAAASRSALYNTSAARVNGKLNVHIISHTHNDPGWLRSYAQYHRPFELNGRVVGGVEAILETVVSSLVDNPDRTFVYADLAFFVKWWQELHEDTKAVVRQLVQQGRFEFAGGGIVQHDEATSHYSGMVDQMSLGMRFLQQEFGRAPTVAWQLDGFGHSCTEALLKSMGGFQALFIGRSDMADMQQRKSNRSLEFVWRGSESYGAQSDLFVSQCPTGNYGPPTMDWFFEQNLQEKPLPAHIDDDPETGSFTVDKAVDLFVQKAQEWQQYMHGDDIYFLMGHDFTHSEARMWFSNIDKLIHYVNKDGRVNALYSTPARYTAAKLLTPGLQLALKTDDFFPYSSSEAGDEYWAGFYTSRPTLKTQIRRGWALLRAMQQLEVLAQLQPGSSRLATSMGLQYNHPADASETARLGSKLAPDHDPAVLEFALATSLHHDGITGTQRQQVAQNYEQWLHIGMVKAAPKFLQGLQQLVFPKMHGSNSEAATALPLRQHSRQGTVFRRKLAMGEAPDDEDFDLQHYLGTNDDSDATPQTKPLVLSMCLNLNISLCSSSVALSKGSGFLLVVYNPLSWEYARGIRVPVANGSYAVTDPQGKPVRSQLLPVSNAAQLAWSSSKEAQEDSSRPDSELALLVSAPALGHAVYKVMRLSGRSNASNADGASSDKQPQPQHASAATTSEAVHTSTNRTLANTQLSVEVGPAGISSVTFEGRRMLFRSQIIKYQGRHPGAGAYIFTAEGQPESPTPSKVVITQGPVVQEVQQHYPGLGVLTTRMWDGKPYLEVEWAVGPPPAVRTGWEVFVRYSSSIKSEGLWFTDANGREYQQRKRQYRPSFKLPAAAAALASNIYPITTGCRLQDNAQPLQPRQMHVAVDHAHGAVSLADGQLDIHLHRTTAGDDHRGMVEPLMDSHVAAGSHTISFFENFTGNFSHSNAGGVPQASRHFEQMLNDPLQLAFGAIPNTEHAELQATSGTQDPADNLPANVHLPTAKWLGCNTVLLRLSHMFQSGEHPTLSRPARVQLSAVAELLRANITSVQETTLFGERPLTVSDSMRPVFNISHTLTVWKPPLVLPPSLFSFINARLVGPIPGTTSIRLNPMQIRTFFVTVARKSACVDPPAAYGAAANAAATNQHQAAAVPPDGMNMPFVLARHPPCLQHALEFGVLQTHHVLLLLLQLACFVLLVGMGSYLVAKVLAKRCHRRGKAWH